VLYILRNFVTAVDPLQEYYQRHFPFLEVQLSQAYLSIFNIRQEMYDFGCVELYQISHVMYMFNYAHWKLSHYRPGQAWFRENESPEFKDNLHMDMIMLSALGTENLYTPDISPLLIPVRTIVRP